MHFVCFLKNVSCVMKDMEDEGHRTKLRVSASTKITSFKKRRCQQLQKPPPPATPLLRDGHPLVFDAVLMIRPFFSFQFCESEGLTPMKELPSACTRTGPLHPP